MNDNGEKIVFHDEEVVQEKKGPICNKAIYAFVGSMVYLVCIVINNFIWITDKFTIFNVLAIIAFFGSIILGAISLKEIKKKALSGKSFAVLAIILPIVFMILTTFLVILINGDEFKEGFKEGFYCPNSSECVDNGDKTSTCITEDGNEIKCHNELLKSSQYK